jgi:hypothetical protein
VAKRAPGGTKSELPAVVVTVTNLTIACFAGPSFHEGSGSGEVWALTLETSTQSNPSATAAARQGAEIDFTILNESFIHSP